MTQYVHEYLQIQDGYSDDTEESEDEDEGRIATNLKSMTVVSSRQALHKTEDKFRRGRRAERR